MFAPTAGFTESSMEVVIILTICAPVDSRLSRDFASIAVPTSLRVLDWAGPIDNEGISIRFFLSAQLFIYSGSADAARTQFPILIIVIFYAAGYMEPRILIRINTCVASIAYF